MGFVHLPKRFDAPPETVFEHVVRTDRLPMWLAPIVSVSNAAERLDAVGAKMDAELKLGGRLLHTTWEVVKVDPPHSLRAIASAEEGGAADLWARLDRWDSATEMELELDYELPGGFVATVADKLFVERLITRDVMHSLETLRQMIATSAA